MTPHLSPAQYEELVITTALLLGAEIKPAREGSHIYSVSEIRGTWSTRRMAAAVYLSELHGIEVRRDGTVHKFPECLTWRVKT